MTQIALKLFVWADPYPVEYGNSAYFAVAETVDQAREMAMTAPAYSGLSFEMITRRDVILGDPTRIVDLPCAEWHEWSE